MISYIFKNRTKNIFAIIFTVFCMLKPLNNLWQYVFFFQTIDIYTVFTLLPYIIIFVYFLTLKCEYKIKPFMFPSAFAIWIGLQFYNIISSISSSSYLTNVSDTTYLDVDTFLWLIFSISAAVIAIISSVFGFIGTLNNFKNVVFLRISSIISISLYAVITPITEFIMVGSVKYLDAIEDYYLKYVYTSMVETLIQRIIWILFFVGILLLTLNKKSENIDITPFVEERKAKKETKRAMKLQKKQQEQEYVDKPMPEIPDGCWRCMACGNVLNNEIPRCECGYKR